MAGARRISADLLDDNVKASIEKVAQLDDRVSAIENAGGTTHAHNNYAVLQGFDFTDELVFNGVSVSLGTHEHDNLYVRKTHELDSTIHLSTTQIEKLSATQTSKVSNTQPTTDVWYKIIK